METNVLTSGGLKLETAVKRLYEGLFLIDSALAAADWDQVLGMLRKFLDRAGADVVSMKKWDDRKLAYDIQGKGRGTYILIYFNCDPSRIHGIERDVQLSEQVMRVMILRTDRMSQNDINRPTPAELHPEGSYGETDSPEVREAPELPVEEIEELPEEDAPQVE
jgi:small subunit ribosomal protein S6